MTMSCDCNDDAGLGDVIPTLLAVDKITKNILVEVSFLLGFEILDGWTTLHIWMWNTAIKKGWQNEKKNPHQYSYTWMTYQVTKQRWLQLVFNWTYIIWHNMSDTQVRTDFLYWTLTWDGHYIHAWYGTRIWNVRTLSLSLFFLPSQPEGIARGYTYSVFFCPNGKH